MSVVGCVASQAANTDLLPALHSYNLNKCRASLPWVKISTRTTSKILWFICQMYGCFDVMVSKRRIRRSKPIRSWIRAHQQQRHRATTSTCTSTSTETAKQWHHYELQHRHPHQHHKQHQHQPRQLSSQYLSFHRSLSSCLLGLAPGLNAEWRSPPCPQLEMPPVWQGSSPCRASACTPRGRRCCVEASSPQASPLARL